MQIHAHFDSGNIEVLDASDPGDIRLAIRPDPVTQTPEGEVQFAQWFHFRVDGRREVPLTLHIVNAATAAYPAGWPDYRCVVSTDREQWLRTDTTYQDGVLTIAHTPDADACWFAYFAPYDLTRVATTVAAAAQHPDVSLDPVGLTLDGRAIDRLIVGDPARSLPTLWLIARQHPGESMASWWMEGMLDRLLDDDDRISTGLRGGATLHVVPHMNPDGSFRGHLRTNAAGANLNREWATPSAERSPEVLHTRTAMDASGVQFCIDVHGDEALPYTFISGAEGVPSWSEAMAAQQKIFLDAYERANPALQQVHGYPISPAGEGNLTMATDAVAERFGCLSMTLEMPFKDDANAPDLVAGWSPEKAYLMGRAAVDAMWAVLPMLSGVDG